MRSLRLAFASFAAVLATLDALAAERLGERYLVEMRVSAPDGCRFVTFLPAANGNTRVWSDERLGKWKKRVSSRVLLPGGAALPTADVCPLPFGEPFAAIPARMEFLRFLSGGQEGLEVLPFADGSATTNRFLVASLPEGRGEARLMWQREDKSAPFVLRVGQGASQQIWFVTWEMLSERWRALLRDKKAAEVRDEMEIIRDSGRLSAEGGAAWRKRLDDFHETQLDLWPGIAFTNLTDDAVSVSCGGVSWNLPPGGSWTKRVTKKPDGDGVPWSFVRAGSEELPEEFTFEPIPWRMDEKYDIPVAIHPSARKSKGAPRLEISNRLIPSEEILSRLGRNEPNVVVRYADGIDMPLAVLEKEGRRYVEVDPRRGILAFEIDAPFCERATLKPVKDYYRNGDEIELRGKLALRPWPRLEITNPRSDRVITNTITYHVPGEVAPLAGSPARVVVVPPGETRTVVPDPGSGAGGRIELEVSIVSSAAYATETAHSLPRDKFRRGAAGIPLSLEPKCDEIPSPPKPAEKPHMPEVKKRFRLASKVAGIFADIDQYVTSMPGKRDTMRDQIRGLPADRKETVRAVGRHLANCGNGCNECAGFRAHLTKVGASWAKPTDKHILQACYREYLIANKGRTEEDADASVNDLRPYLETLPDNWAGGGAEEDNP